MRFQPAKGRHIARALIALLAMLLAFGPPLDSAAHAAAQTVEAGSTSPILKFIAAFDVLDDSFDHDASGALQKQAQIVITMAMPAPVLASFEVTHESPVEHQFALAEPVPSFSPSPLDRPPRA